MNEKILTADLVNAVAELTAIPKNRCDDFVKAFFEAIANALSIDGVVKVKGLGTFKLISVEERKSVNVQTGAEMIIPAHAKVSFTPDKALKDEINKPYAHLKTYVLNPNAPLDPPEVDDDEDVVVENNDEEIHSAVDDVASNPIVAGGAVSQTENTAIEPLVSEESVSAESSVAENVVTDEISADVESSSHAETESISSVPENVVSVEPETTTNAESNSSATEHETASGVEKEETISENCNDTNAESSSSHSDWFDNWEVEYEGEGVENPKAIAVDKSTETQVATQPEVEVVDEVTASLEEDGNGNSADVEKENDVVIGASVPSETNEQIVATEESNEQGPAEQDSTSEVTGEATDVDGSEEPVTEVSVDTDDGPAEQAAAMAAPEEKVAVEGQFKYAYHDNDEDFVIPEKVNRGKVLGVGIITFLVLLVAAFIGIQKIDPDFFKSLKASSDNPPVMPADTTTSLAQELSVYVPDADTVVAATELVEMAEDSSVVEENNASEVDAEKDIVPATPRADFIDPLWNGEFVAYMKRQHKDVSLATSGLIGETAIKPGLFLTMVALQNYGDKSYWIYLYLYNTDRIKNPNNVPVGTKIRVPNLDKSLVNGPNETQVNLAKEIRQKFVK